MKEITEFLESKEKRTFLHIKDMELYIRKSKRSFNDKRLLCLDIARIEVSEKKRGKGLFKKWLSEIELLVSKRGMVVYVECVNEDRLASHLRRRGYIQMQSPYPDISPCFFSKV